MRKPVLIALGCTLSGLAATVAVAGDLSNSTLLILAALPAAGLLVYGLRKAVSFAGRLDVFAPLVAFPVLYIAWFALGSIDLIDVASTINFGLFEPIPWYVLGYAALGLTGYLAGAALKREQPAGNREERTPGFAWREDRFAVVIAGLGALMLASYCSVITNVGAIPAMSSDASEIRLRIAESGPAAAVMFTSAWTLIPLLMMYIWRRRPVGRVRLLCYGGVAVTSLLLLSLGGRSYVFVPLLTTLVARHYGKRRFAIRKLALVCLTLFCGLSFFGYVRDTALYGQGFGEDRLGIPGAVVPFVYSYLYVRYPVATFRDITAIVPDKIPYQYGWLSVGPLATILPGRHEQSDMFFKNVLGNDFIGAGQPATLLGPLYADAGLCGILGGLFLSGMLVSRVYAWMLAAPTVIRVLLYAWLMQTLLLSLFANLFPYITTLWIPAFWMVLHRFLRPPRGAGESPLNTRRQEANS